MSRLLLLNLQWNAFLNFFIDCGQTDRIALLNYWIIKWAYRLNLEGVFFELRMM